MKRRWKVTLGVLVTLLVLVEAADYFLAESTAIAWHLRHGSPVELGGYKFQVPYLYYADDPHGLGTLTISKLPGRLQHGMAMITLEFRKQPSPDELRSVVFEQTMARVHLRKTGERGAMLAGRPGTCVEYSEDVSNTGQDRMTHLLSGVVTIRCSFGENLGAGFLGSAELKEEFYEIMRTAEPRKGKS